ncbi:hypothetical protein HNP46_000490 [Pseudomonas nitritireducens]|uniref:Uncharacterized protein n=1 Tax=Pseudomonas nitroreducens TaxID=46680 RepID=A0A7W7NZK0_PSENT|nr:hypothetical protein [Pseudomonas nitritireducens]MBB4861679.1 hypothetical protein [Pseudomonas nitritireducens]
MAIKISELTGAQQSLYTRLTAGEPLAGDLTLGYRLALEMLSEDLLARCIELDGPEAARERLGSLRMLKEFRATVLAEAEAGPVPQMFIDVLRRVGVTYRCAFEQETIAMLLRPVLARINSNQRGIGVWAANLVPRMLTCKAFVSEECFKNPYIGNVILQSLDESKTERANEENYKAIKLVVEHLAFDLDEYRGVLKKIGQNDPRIYELVNPIVGVPSFEKIFLAGLMAKDVSKVKGDIQADPGAVYAFLNHLPEQDFHRAMTDDCLTLMLLARWVDSDAYPMLSQHKGFQEGHEAFVRRLFQNPIYVDRVKEIKPLWEKASASTGLLFTHVYARRVGVRMNLPYYWGDSNETGTLAKLMIADKDHGLFSEVSDSLRAILRNHVHYLVRNINIECAPYQVTCVPDELLKNDDDKADALALQWEFERGRRDFEGAGDLDELLSRVQLPLTAKLSAAGELPSFEGPIMKALVLGVPQATRDAMARHSDEYKEGAMHAGLFSMDNFAELSDKGQTKFMINVLDM